MRVDDNQPHSSIFDLKFPIYFVYKNEELYRGSAILYRGSAMLYTRSVILYRGSRIEEIASTIAVWNAEIKSFHSACMHIIVRIWLSFQMFFNDKKSVLKFFDFKIYFFNLMAKNETPGKKISWHVPTQNKIGWCYLIMCYIRMWKAKYSWYKKENVLDNRIKW